MAASWGKKEAPAPTPANEPVNESVPVAESVVETYNVVTNWTMKCWEVNQRDETPNKLRLNCSFGNIKKEDGTYQKGFNVTVWVNLDECDIPEDDYAGAIICVSGRSSVSEYKNKNGDLMPQLNINATSVKKRIFDKK